MGWPPDRCPVPYITRVCKTNFSARRRSGCPYFWIRKVSFELVIKILRIRVPVYLVGGNNHHKLTLGMVWLFGRDKL